MSSEWLLNVSQPAQTYEKSSRFSYLTIIIIRCAILTAVVSFCTDFSKINILLICFFGTAAINYSKLPRETKLILQTSVYHVVLQENSVSRRAKLRKQKMMMTPSAKKRSTTDCCSDWGSMLCSVQNYQTAMCKVPQADNILSLTLHAMFAYA